MQTKTGEKNEVRECGHLLLWLGIKVRKVEENGQKSWVGSSKGSRS